MLTKILSGKSCAACRVCCVFDRDDVWEMPLVSEQLKEYIEKEKIVDTDFVPAGKEYRFSVEFEENEELVNCPALTDTGCALGKNKPFDCSIWPFRLMRIDENLCGITVSPVCGTVSALSVSSLSDFVNNHRYDNGKTLLEIITAYATEHPDIIKPYIENYPILSIVKM